MHDDFRYDAIIIGAGAAGASCALWLARLGFSPLLIEAGKQVGGLCLVHPFPDNWNVSLPDHTGPQVAHNFAVSLERAQVPLMLSTPVESVQKVADGFIVKTANGRNLRGAYVVLATGTRARGFDAPGASATGPREQPYPGVLIGPGDHIVAQDFSALKVAVLGGGDNGFENALYAMDHGADEVTIFARTVRAQHQFVKQMPAEQVVLGDYEVDPVTRRVNGRAFDLIMVFYGWEPCVNFAQDLPLERSERGYIATDISTAQTSCNGVYAIGEVAQRFHPCVVTAMADGVTAAKAIQARIEAAPLFN